jgi:hypothetical protein
MDFIKSLDPNQGQQVYQYSRTYWGNQPIVAAPAYVGASILFLFFLGLFTLKNINMRWLTTLVIISLILSWGKNFNFLTNLMIDFFPLYDKFRAVSSIQVILEFCVPLLAVIGLNSFLSEKTSDKNKTSILIKTVLITLPLTLIIYFFGDVLFHFKSNFEIFGNYPDILKLLIEERKILLKTDTLRSLLIILGISFLLFAYLKNILSKNVILYSLIIIIVVDLWSVNTKYVNADQFVEKIDVERPFKLTNADRAILQDTLDFRVFEPQRGFSNARTSFFHKSIAGYHAAKPKRIQDLYDFYISKNNIDILNMLNVKYIIENDPENPIGVTRNPNNFGNAWFIEKIKNVSSSDEELTILNNIDLRSTVVSQELNEKTYSKNILNSVKLKQRKANHLIYEVKSDSEQFIVFSEAFYKNGWKSTINSKPAKHFKVNYLLRGMEVPKGNYDIHFTYNPKIIMTGSIFVIFGSIILLISLFIYIKKI